MDAVDCFEPEASEYPTEIFDSAARPAYELLFDVKLINDFATDNYLLMQFKAVVVSIILECSLFTFALIYLCVFATSLTSVLMWAGLLYVIHISLLWYIADDYIKVKSDYLKLHGVN